MRNPERIDRIMNKLLSLWRRNPDMRITQLIISVAHAARDPFYVDDDVFETLLDEHF